MKKSNTSERLLQAMEYYDKNKVTWQHCIDKFHLCNTYIFMPSEFRTRAGVETIKNLYSLKRNNTKAFQFILEKVFGVKKETVETLFTLDSMTDKELVEELRRRGYQVTAKKEIKQTIEL